MQCSQEFFRFILDTLLEESKSAGAEINTFCRAHIYNPMVAHHVEYAECINGHKSQIGDNKVVLFAPSTNDTANQINLSYSVAQLLDDEYSYPGGSYRFTDSDGYTIDASGTPYTSQQFVHQQYGQLKHVTDAPGGLKRYCKQCATNLNKSANHAREHISGFTLVKHVHSHKRKPRPPYLLISTNAVSQQIIVNTVINTLKVQIEEDTYHVVSFCTKSGNPSTGHWMAYVPITQDLNSFCQLDNSIESCIYDGIDAISRIKYVQIVLLVRGSFLTETKNSAVILYTPKNQDIERIAGSIATPLNLNVNDNVDAHFDHS